MIWTFTSRWPWDNNPYNSYTLQGFHWLQGHLDLGENLEHLELAIFNGKYFVSFPPFPSFALLPFIMLFGLNTPDHFINISFAIVAGIYAFKLCRNFNLKKHESMFWSLFLTVGSNFLF